MYRLRILKSLLLFFLVSVQLVAQPIPRSNPEAQGVSSEKILSFLDALAQSKHEFHSIIIVRHGKVIAEGWWNPYQPDLTHTLYSLSKSFTATAIGFAVMEGKVSLDDKMISFFPDETPSNVSPNLSNLRVRDLLSMTAGQAPDPTRPVVVSENWAKTFLNTPILNEPGTKFLYNSVATYMLSAIVTKVTGQTALEYLTPRLFKPLGISGIDWETSPQGINTGGWGLRLHTEDIAKFGQVFLDKGKWKGKQLIPVSWVEEASSTKIMQDPDAPQSRKDSSDWLQGYCFQMWRSRHHSYRGDGAFGQYALILPDQDAVIAITSESSNMQGELNIIWNDLLPAFTDKKKLPSNSKVQKELKERLASLNLPTPKSDINSSLETSVSGKSYGVYSGLRSFEGFEVDFKDGNCILTQRTDSVDHKLVFGKEKWVSGETTRKGPYLVTGAVNYLNGLPIFKTMGSYRWVDQNTLELTLRYIQSPHTETITCKFDGDHASIASANSFNPNSGKEAIKAVAVNQKSDGPRLIVRGDDMGFSHSANVALIKSYKEGIETSIEVIVPSPWFPETVRLLAQNPGVDVGLHFAITSEWDNLRWRPLTDCPSIQDADGYFYQMLYKNKNYPNGAVMDHSYSVSDIEKELRAQIEMAKKYIPRLSHVSGHMGSTGFDPKVKEMVAKLGDEYHLPMVDADAMKKYSISYIGFDSRNKTTEQRIDGFLEMLNKLEDGKTYVFVEHPGIDDDELRAISHIGYEDVAQGRQDVTNIFTSEKVREAILTKGIQLVSYEEVMK